MGVGDSGVGAKPSEIVKFAPSEWLGAACSDSDYCGISITVCIDGQFQGYQRRSTKRQKANMAHTTRLH
ncbi:hypothetical protein RRG08_036614 [Elysia crispata]|uniref:Uncharacterized protein n=1 Tax=Elysia crispata TaxID=231223 RepID=A0AAE1DKC3_9GAST|nr:hypothetical protein RRG08_036614 [Elysia crispata]